MKTYEIYLHEATGIETDVQMITKKAIKAIKKGKSSFRIKSSKLASKECKRAHKQKPIWILIEMVPDESWGNYHEGFNRIDIFIDKTLDIAHIENDITWLLPHEIRHWIDTTVGNDNLDGYINPDDSMEDYMLQPVEINGAIATMLQFRFNDGQESWDRYSFNDMLIATDFLMLWIGLGKKSRKKWYKAIIKRLKQNDALGKRMKNVRF